MRRRRRKKGVSLVETLAGMMVLLPVALGAVDVVTLIGASHTNEEWAETAARAAARRGSKKGAERAAQEAVQLCRLNNIIKSIAVADVDFDLGNGQVMVTTVMEVEMPIGLPFYGSEVTFRHNAIQPIVSIPAPI